jgi:hypothetical protein
MARSLAFLGSYGGELRDVLSHVATAASRADDAALFELSDVKNCRELFLAVVAEEDVMRHDHASMTAL